MNKETALKLLGTIQTDLISAKKEVESKKIKFDKKFKSLQSVSNRYGGRAPFSVSRDRDFYKKEIVYLQKKMDEYQNKIDAIKFARDFIKNQ